MPEQKKVVIAGAGLGGICAATHLLRAGIEDFVILDRESEPGGTWRDNTYPGCACDVPVALILFRSQPAMGAPLSAGSRNAAVHPSVNRQLRACAALSRRRRSTIRRMG